MSIVIVRYDAASGAPGGWAKKKRCSFAPPVLSPRESLKQMWQYAFIPPCFFDETKVRAEKVPTPNKRQDFVTCIIWGESGGWQYISLKEKGFQSESILFMLLHVFAGAKKNRGARLRRGGFPYNLMKSHKSGGQCLPLLSLSPPLSLIDDTKVRDTRPVAKDKKKGLLKQIFRRYSA